MYRAEKPKLSRNSLFKITFGTKRNYLTPLSSGLSSGLKMKVVKFSVSFPTYVRGPQSDECSSSYALRDERCQITVYSENK